MVLEQIFKPTWIEKKPHHALILGMFYSFLGIVSAWIIFPEDVGIASIAFISILVLPSLNALLSIEENKEIRQKKISLVQLIKDHWDIIYVYIFLFLGIFITYTLLSLRMNTAISINLLAPQLSHSAVVGGSVSSGYYFFSILMNNLKVFTVMLILSLAYGAGAILFLTWNASVWGSALGFAIRKKIMILGMGVVESFAGLFAKFFPHMIVEAMAYFFVIVAGGTISKAVIREKIGTKKFHHVFSDALIFFAIGIILLVLGALIEVYLYPVL
ncbi:stage II sporulation protein M [Candidatus Woesearchaeota archaeon]|nr:stage II sporulation protein M [Candidatus Woesearchaeota archaeon]